MKHYFYKIGENILAMNLNNAPENYVSYCFIILKTVTSFPEIISRK
jgi:hypothetical protein